VAIAGQNDTPQSLLRGSSSASEYNLLGENCKPQVIPNRMNEFKVMHPEVFVATFADAIRKSNKGQQNYKKAIDFYFSYDENNISLAENMLERCMNLRKRQKNLN